MLPRDEIANAVEIQKGSYNLLRWIGDAIDRGVITIGDATERGGITFSRPHGTASAADAAFDWIGEHYENLPAFARPQPDQLRPFSNYFGSFVTTSFDLIRDPGERLQRLSSCDCYCELCSHLVEISISHLQPKKPLKRDKERAIKECIARIKMLAKEEGLQISSDSAAALVDSHRREAAYSAYGFSLLERIGGSDGGVYVLALWRMIAWKPEGSPIKGFTLEANDIFDAEHELATAIARNGESGRRE